VVMQPVYLDHSARGGKIHSPLELARVIAGGTSRNAWHDLFIKRPWDSEWTLADHLRRRMLK